MVAGAVSYHRPDNVRRISVEKNNPIVKALERTKEERYPDLAQEQQDRLNEIIRQNKAAAKQQAKEEQMARLEREREKEARSYDRIMKTENMTAVSEMNATADATAAEEYEDDFF